MKTNPLNVEEIKKRATSFTEGTPKQRYVARLKYRILEQDNFQCRKCKSPDNLTIDHIKTMGERRNETGRKLSGSEAIYAGNADGVQILCTDCHAQKNMTEHPEQQPKLELTPKFKFPEDTELFSMAKISYEKNYVKQGIDDYSYIRGFVDAIRHIKKEQGE